MATKDSVLQGLTILADLYTKSKALDLAESQFMIQREGAIADRQFKERQLDIAENKALSTEKLAELQVNMSVLNDLRNEKRTQEAAYTKAYGVNPVYKTSALEEIGSIMQGNLDSKIQGVGEFINTLGNQLDELSIMRGALQAEETYFAEESSKYAGLNRVLEDHEFETLISDAKQLPQFEDSEGIGFRAAFNKQGTPLRRIAVAKSMTQDMKKESSDLATIQYSAMQTMTNNNEDFDWEANFGSKEMAEAAKEVLLSTDYKHFLANINMPGNESLRNVFRSNPALRGQLANIEGNAQRVYALDAEFAGQPFTAGAPLGNFVEEYEAIVSTADLGQGNKAAMFDAYKNFVANRGITDRATLDQMFSILEDKYGQDLGPDFQRWMDDPDAFASPDDPPPPAFESEVSSLDALIEEFDRVTSDKEKIATEESTIKTWESDVSGDYNKLYVSAPSDLQRILEDTIGPSFKPAINERQVGLAKQHIEKNIAGNAANFTDEQWASLDDQVAMTVSAMMQQPAPGLVEFGLGLGGTLASTVGLADEGTARDMLKTGRASAKNLLEAYAEYKSKVQDKPTYSDEVKQLMEEYSIDEPMGSRFNMETGTWSDIPQKELNKEEEERRLEQLDELKRIAEGFESVRKKNEDIGNQMQARNPFLPAEEDWEAASFPDSTNWMTSFIIPIDPAIENLEGWGRNPFEPVEE